MPKPKPSQWSTWEDMPLDEFQKRAETARKEAAAFVTRMEELFPGRVTLTAEQRKVAPRLRDGEHAMLNRVLDVVDLKPMLFESLADHDDGTDPDTLETPLLRDRIEKHRLFGEIDKTLTPLAGRLRDSGFYLAGKFREVVLAAYRIGKTHALTDRAINDILAPVIDFMRKGAVAAAATRAAKKNEK